MANRPWEVHANFPDSPFSWGVFWPLVGRFVEGKEAVDKCLKRPNLLEPVLVSTPATKGKFLPTILAAEPQTGSVDNRIKSDKRKIVRLMLFYLISLPLLFYFVASLCFSLIVLILLLVMYLYTDFEHRMITGDDNVLKEKACFYSWLFINGREYLYVTIAFFLAIGIAQYLLILLYGSNDEALERFGLLFVGVSDNNEWWRFLTAPLMHAGIAHWLSNLFIGCSFAVLCGPIMKRQLYWLALVSAAVSFLVVYFVKINFALNGDGIIGMSGGIAGPLGWLIAISIKQQQFFPEKFFVTAIFTAFITLIAVSFLMAPISFICHAAGLVFGIIIGTAQKVSFASETETS